MVLYKVAMPCIMEWVCGVWCPEVERPDGHSWTLRDDIDCLNPYGWWSTEMRFVNTGCDWYGTLLRLVWITMCCLRPHGLCIAREMDCARRRLLADLGGVRAYPAVPQANPTGERMRCASDYQLMNCVDLVDTVCTSGDDTRGWTSPLTICSSDCIDANSCEAVTGSSLCNDNVIPIWYDNVIPIQFGCEQMPVVSEWECTTICSSDCIDANSCEAVTGSSLCNDNVIPIWYDNVIPIQFGCEQMPVVSEWECTRERSHRRMNWLGSNAKCESPRRLFWIIWMIGWSIDGVDATSYPKILEKSGLVCAADVRWTTADLLSMSEGPGISCLENSVDDDISLWDRVAEAVPEGGHEATVEAKASGSDDWFCGKMSDHWFKANMSEVDHRDDRVRRDWSLKVSEGKKGPNRFANQWSEFMAGIPYTDPTALPYTPKCGFGELVSSDAEIEKQRALCLAYCELLRSYSALWTKTMNRHPVAGVLFSGGGLLARGFLWMGVRCILVDICDQPEAPVGSDCVSVKCDVMKMDIRKLTVDWIQGSPPCPPTSTAPAMGGMPSKVEQLIPEFKQMMKDNNAARDEAGLVDMLWILENVASSGEFMTASMITDGQHIGSRVNRKRMLEANFDLSCELSHDLYLCLGDRAKWPRTDDSVITAMMKQCGVCQESRPDFHLVPPCCRGSSWSPVGSHTSHTGSRSRWAKAMGVEDGLSRRSVVNGLHSLQGALMCGLMMRKQCQVWDVPTVSLQMLMEDPSWIARIRIWKVTLIASIPKLLGFKSEVKCVMSDPSTADTAGDTGTVGMVTDLSSTEDTVNEDSTDAEMWYGGDFQLDPEYLAQVQWSNEGDFSVHVTDSVQDSMLHDMCGVNETVAWDVDVELEHQHALVEVSVSLLDRVIPWAVSQVLNGSKVSIVTPCWVDATWFAQLKKLGFVVCDQFVGEHTIRARVLRPEVRHWPTDKLLLWQKCPMFDWSMGDVCLEESVLADPTQLWPKKPRVPQDHPIETDEVGMRELGVYEAIIDLTQDQDGRGIVPIDEPGTVLNDTKQYDLDPAALEACVDEMARITKRGVLVRAADHPDIKVTDIHSWVMVFQGKWRAALDTKSLNQRTVNIPFPLPKHRDLEGVVKAGKTSFIARDLSDGFYHNKIGRRFWGRFALRHPVTKEVWLFTRPPFGWTLSPWFFTRFSEEVGRRLEPLVRRALEAMCIERGWLNDFRMKLLVYVDDYLLAINHDHHTELAERAGEIIDAAFA
jgi:hypothetical protein